MNNDHEQGRSAAEWTTFAGACLILLVVIGMLIAQMGDQHSPAEPVAVLTGEIRQVGASHHVEVEVTNVGSSTAAEVTVEAKLELAGEVSVGEQVVDFLAPGDKEHLVFVFDNDPSVGRLSVRVSGYAVP
ncbi:MAG: TIGR02588 family protein [Acidimicrobiia bacterium]